MGFTIAAAVSEKVGFASHQNAIPILRDLSVANESEVSIEDVQLSLTADPPFLSPKTWHIDRLLAGTQLYIKDRLINLNGQFLADLTEAVSGRITLTLAKDDAELASASVPVELLARAEWGGMNAMPELLAAFVMPNDPAVDRILKAASNVLRRAGKPDGIDGYSSGSRTRSWELASAIWSAIVGMQISYALPPASFEKQGQRVRPPSVILDGRLATCLDTALLFAAALEQAGLNPIVVLTRGHAFVGVWLQPTEFPDLVTTDAAELRKRIALNELLVFETTLVTKHPAVPFRVAQQEAEKQIAEDVEGEFEMALDVRRARMQRLKPLASAAGLADPTSSEPTVSEGLEEAPNLPGFDVEITTSPATAADRVALWQRKLLDLTTRNRLLHLSESAKAVRLYCPKPAELEDLLAAGKKVRITAMPDLEAAGRDSVLYNAQYRENLRDEYAKDALTKAEVLAGLPKDKLEPQLIDLFRKARTDIEEGGANTLFLALGFLKWRKSATETRVYRAPLVLVPVKLERKSAVSGVVMTAHEDETRFNMTLLELLRQDFELTIPPLEGPLPSDDHGVDIGRIWNIVRMAVRDVPGFEVIEDIYLGTFSFSKYLMWKDLTDRADQLKQSPVVHHLIERGEKTFRSGGEFPRPEDLDRDIAPVDLFMPLPADSSQTAAVVASGRGCDFVLDGPPGTGKSQTIANMIAHNLALGRRVLFVAEKMAALEVVYRRLAEKGLADFCLELHSNKTSKTEVLKQLDRAWNVKDTLTQEEWQREAAEVKRLRDSLNEIVQILHEPKRNGLTIHAAMGRVIRDADSATPALNWPEGTAHSADQLTQLRDIARRLGLSFSAVGELPMTLFAVISGTDWSNSWQSSIVAAARDLPVALDAVLAAADNALQASGFSLPVDTLEDAERLITLLEAVLASHGQDLQFAFAPNHSDIFKAAGEAEKLLDLYRTTEQGLSASYAAEACRRVDIRSLQQAWAETAQKFWPFNILARRTVAKTLAAQGGVVGRPNPGNDLPSLATMADALKSLDELAPRLQSVPGWAGLASDRPRLATAVASAQHIRQALSAAALDPEMATNLRGRVRTIVVDGNDLLASDGRLQASASILAERVKSAQVALGSFLSLAGNQGEQTISLATLKEMANAIVANEARLKAWCDWRRVCAEAKDMGLAPLVSKIEAGALPAAEVQPSFETAYARWFASTAIDADPRLRSFVPEVHLDDIRAYRTLEERLAELSVRYVRARICGLLPDRNEVSKADGYGILKHELAKQRRHKPVRQLATEMGEAFTRLAPCMLMSPLSIAQYLPPDQSLFDLVIFDEASQIAPWDAVGSIARGRQVVIAGDPRQMPPTNFFSRGDGDDGSDGGDEDAESILDECLAAGVPRHLLTWHYRSRHESLITFSNHHYYDGSLVTFPAAVTKATAVEWRRVDGVYTKGVRTNQLEAKAIVAEAVKRLTDPAFVAAKRSLGIITLNSEQQKLIEDLLDQERSKRPALERFFARDSQEPVFVKNLETVQGDERDVILLGICFGPTEPGAPAMSMNFGPLNKDGGWRRLNVALTRARHEMLAFTSFDPGMIDLRRTSARAVRDLKHFLEFAQRGPSALAEAVQGSVGGFDSPFEEAVARALRDRGWEVVPQIGVSRFRIDLGIVHPDRPGDYLVGVECDGAAYHSAATARDRDKVRQSILESLGWKLLRVWSTDWWVDMASASERLHRMIQQALADSREACEHANHNPAAPHTDASATTNDGACNQLDQPPPGYAGETETAKPLAAPSAVPAEAQYRHADLSSFDPIIDPASFYSPSYDHVLNQLVEAVAAAEAPVSLDDMIQRIARAHRFLRAKSRIRERIENAARRRLHLHKDGMGIQFVWLNKEHRASFNMWRPPARAEHIRMIDQIPLEELRAAAPDEVTDAAVEIARRFGVRRLSADAKSRIEAAIKRL